MSAATATMPTVRAARQEDLERLRWLRREANRRPLDGAGWRDRGRVLETAHGICAALRAGDAAQFVGGAAVPIAILDTVMVAPEARGQGNGTTLLLHVLNDIRDRGTPAVSLYPTTIPFYRRFGFGVAGVRTRYRAPLPPRSRDGVMQVEQWDDNDLESIAACYHRFARQSAGLLARSPAWWHEWVLYDSPFGQTYRYVVRQDGEVTGYVIYDHELVPSLLDRYVIRCRDLVWNTPESGQSLLAFFAANRPLADGITWCGSPEEPLTMLFDQLTLSSESTYLWMTRLLDPVAALAARGYPAGISLAVDFAVHDPLWNRNSTGLHLELAEGKVGIQRSATTSPVIHVDTLASMFTGMLRPRDAHRLGRLPASSDDVDKLELVFSGPRPWLLDEF